MFEAWQEVPQRTRGSASTPHQSGHGAHVPTPHPSIRRREIAGGNCCCSTSIRHCFGPRLSKWTITLSVCSQRDLGLSVLSPLQSGVSQYMSPERCLLNWSHFCRQYEDVLSRYSLGQGIKCCCLTVQSESLWPFFNFYMQRNSQVFDLRHSVTGTKRCKYFLGIKNNSHFPNSALKSVQHCFGVPWMENSWKHLNSVKSADSCLYPLSVIPTLTTVSEVLPCFTT